MIALDASAALAFLFREPGHERVAERLAEACMSTVNLAEVLGRFARDGKDVAAVEVRLRASPIEWVSFDARQAVRAAELVPSTRAAGLSLGDRACLALASLRGVPAVTADRRWADVDLKVDVVVVR